MSKNLSRFLQIAIPLGLGIFLIWYTYTSFTPEQLTNIKLYFANADYFWVLLSVCCSVISHVCRAYRWNFMLEPLGYKPKVANNFMAISIAYFMNIFIPKSGEVTRGVILDKYEKVPFEKGFGTIISERVVDLIFLLIFTVIALFLRYDELYDYLQEVIPPNFLYYAVFGMLGLTLLIILFLKFSKSDINKKIKKFVLGLKDGVLSIVKMKKKIPFLLYTFVIWGLYLLSFYVALFALPETSAIAFGTILITFVVGSFTFAFTNSGFGTYPYAIMGMLLVFGIAKEVGVAFGWIVWTSNIASIVFFGMLSFIFLPIYNRSKL